MSNNHVGHRQYIFGAPNQYAPPIRNVLTKLQAGAEISWNEIVLFKLAIDLGELDTFLGINPIEAPDHQMALFGEHSNDRA